MLILVSQLRLRLSDQHPSQRPPDDLSNGKSDVGEVGGYEPRGRDLGCEVEVGTRERRWEGRFECEW